MKSFGKISILFIVSIVLLAGCNNPFKKAEQELKERVYSCADLKNETARAECIAQTNDIVLSALSSEITNAFDAKRCVELPQEMADDCVKTIQEAGVQGTISDEQIQALHDAMEPSFKMPEGTEGQDIEGEPYYDLTKCVALTEAGLKEYCEKQINNRIEEETISKIVQSGDATKCDDLKNETSKKICKIELGTFEEVSENVQPPKMEEGTEPVETPEPANTAEEIMP